MGFAYPVEIRPASIMSGFFYVTHFYRHQHIKGIIGLTVNVNFLYSPAC